MLQQSVLNKISQIEEQNFNKFFEFHNKNGIFSFKNITESKNTDIDPYLFFMSNFNLYIRNLFSNLELQIVGIPKLSLCKLVDKKLRGFTNITELDVAIRYKLDLIVITKNNIRRYKKGIRKFCCILNDEQKTYSRVVGHYLYLLYLKQSLLFYIVHGIKAKHQNKR